MKLSKDGNVCLMSSELPHRWLVTTCGDGREKIQVKEGVGVSP